VENVASLRVPDVLVIPEHLGHKRFSFS
jgi:hypothetical protein